MVLGARIAILKIVAPSATDAGLKANRVADYPNLSNYMRELYHLPTVAAKVKRRY